VMAEEARSLAQTHRLVALVHHPLALESGLNASDAAALRESERAALSCARHVVVTSPSTASLLTSDYGVARDLITVVRPGTDRFASPPRPSSDTVSLLAVGSVVPRKGYDVLVAALARLLDLPWRLAIAGDRDRDCATARQLDADIAQHGLGERISFLGAVTSERLMALYAAADLFVLPSRHEGYGMAFTEAIAHGVPVVGTTAGAIAETVPAGAGVLVAPDDVAALGVALRQIIGNPVERDRLAAGARAAAASFPTWQESAALFGAVLEGLS
jgi:glycosyltransferase involved in cell wall biosynthesis